MKTCFKPRIKPMLDGRDDMTGADGAVLLDFLKTCLGAEHDAALARVLEVAPPIVSKLRNGKGNISASILLRMHDVSQISVQALRDVARGGK